VNDWKLVSEEHRNFIENLLRKNFGFFGAPIRLEFREEREEKR
jgi:predicted GTPase